MDGQKILVPYNFTGNDRKTLDFIVQQYCREKDAKITLFHAYTPVPNIEVSDKTIMNLMTGNLSYLRQKISELEEEFGKARERLIRTGFGSDRVHCAFKPVRDDVAQEIIKQAKSGGFDTIVLNHNPSRIKGFFTMSTSKKIVRALPGVRIHMVV